MIKYILKRFGLAMIALTVIIVFVYFLVNLSGRNPIDETLFDVDEVDGIYEKFGLNTTPLERFIVYIKDIFTGEGFGVIYNKGRGQDLTIPELFFGPLKFTLWVTVPTFFISAILGLTLGFTAGYNHGNKVDTIINIFVVFFMGVPSFLLAAFVIAFGDRIGLPVAFIRPDDGSVSDTLKSLVLPVGLLSLTSLAGYTYYTRNEVISILGTNQVQIARSKGLSEWLVFKKHVLRNASIPLAAMLIPSYMTLLAGSFVIEVFFQVQGSSSVIVNAVGNAEYNIVMFNTMFFTILGLLTSIVVDITYVAIDPRIRYSEAGNFKFIENAKASAERNKAFALGDEAVALTKAAKVKGAK